jgi:crotonobetainyl-CoA:carnitine CoA-transferase CaiB-like acyl-CoA transferase
VPLARTPIRLSQTPGEISMRPPLLGEHTQDILAGLGFGKAEVEALRKEGVI